MMIMMMNVSGNVLLHGGGEHCAVGQLENTGSLIKIITMIIMVVIIMVAIVVIIVIIVIKMMMIRRESRQA